jgi:hypothetical protein
MKSVSLIFTLMTVVLAPCEKTRDVPSLHEQLEGRWQVASYLEERFNWNTHSLSRQEIICGPSDIMDFSSFNRLYVRFDTASPAIWTYKVIDFKTLEIEGKSWSITKLDERDLHLSLNKRDSSVKQTGVVRFQLIRP